MTIVSKSSIKVLIVDDSAVARMYLSHLLESDPQIEVIGTVNTGQAALNFLRSKTPDVILMDVNMPGMDGFEATRCIMETQPVPIIICTAAINPRDVATTFRVLEAGAVASLVKPTSREDPNYAETSTNLLQTIKLMSEVKVVRRWPRTRQPHAAGGSAPPMETKKLPRGFKIIGIGASTGGPAVLQTILAGLPKTFAVPILIVQHIAHGFLPGLAEWLNQTTGLQVQIAAYGTLPLPGHVYLAPDGYHLGMSSNGRLSLTKEEPENGLRPAVSYLFRSLAETCGSEAIGILLTGMGKDGAAELRLMKDAGAMTLAQDRESSIVHGMPGEAISLGGATQVLSADKIASAVTSLVSKRTGEEPIEL